MGDLIFVPELGLIAGKSQNLKVRMWYPLPPSTKQRMPTCTETKAEAKSFALHRNSAIATAEKSNSKSKMSRSKMLANSPRS